MVTQEIQQSLRERYNPEGSELRKAQLRMLEILRFLDQTCRQHNLTYWLEGGTLLGAMRHGGFIPWDDDVDVCMPREDAKKLKKILGDNPNSNFILQSNDNDPHYNNCAWYTLRDLKSEYIQDSDLHNRMKYRGLQVDIFIMESGIPKYLKRLARYFNLIFVFGPYAGNKKLKFLRPFVDMNFKTLEKFISPLLRLFKTKESALTYGLGNPFTQYFPSESIYPTKRICFEGETFNSPANPEKYLEIEYGDWNQLPSPVDIQTHEVSFRFFE